MMYQVTFQCLKETQIEWLRAIGGLAAARAKFIWTGTTTALSDFLLQLSHQGTLILEVILLRLFDIQ